MKRTNSRLIIIPNEGTTDEERIRAYDYIRRTAIPTLEDNIINPFSDELKERTEAEAKTVIGIDENGLVRDKYSRTEDIGDIRCTGTIYVTSRTAQETVATHLRNFLDTAQADRGRIREGIRNVEDTTYVHGDYVLEELERIKKEHTTKFNKRELTMHRRQTGEPIKIEPSKDPVLVYFDTRRYKRPNETNMREYMQALGLEATLKAAMKAFEDTKFQELRVPQENLTDKVAIDFELGDGTAIRYLFFGRTTTEYSKVLAALHGKNTKVITLSTGDITLIQELGFPATYEYVRGESSIRVTTEGKKQQGKTTITRKRDDTTDERTYRVLNNEGKIYIAIPDIQRTMDTMTKQHTSCPTQLKIDLFAAQPKETYKTSSEPG